MLGLIKNEFIKEYTIKRIIFITILFIVISLGFILLNGALSNMVIEGNDSKTMLENFKRELKIDQANYEKNKTADNFLHIKTREIMIEEQQLIVDKNLSIDGWRYYALGDAMLLKIRMAPLLMIQSGIDPSSFSAGAQYVDYSMDQINNEIANYQSKIERLLKAFDSNKYYNYVAYQIDDNGEELNRIITKWNKAKLIIIAQYKQAC
jgi:hypothetical protein